MNELTALADQINAAFAEGKQVNVNGRLVKTWSREPAKLWGTGSMSVDVRTKSGNRVTQIWVKPGQTTAIETN